LSNKKDFFISYNKANKDWAEWIAWILEEANYQTIIQAWDFPAGCNFPIAIQNALLKCERVIAILSNEYLNALYTQPEWATAFRKDPTGEKSLLIPIRIDDCKPEGILGCIVYIDLFGKDGNQAQPIVLEKIKEIVGHERLKPKTKPNAPKAGQIKLPKPEFPGPIIPFPKLRIGDIDELIGRKDTLDWLKKHLINKKTPSVALASLHGTGGMGKTFLAHVFVRKYQKKYRFLSIYLGDTSPFNAGSQLLKQLNIDTSAIDSVGKLELHLNEFYSQESGIIIMDDVRSEEVAMLMPQTTAWRVLITTRDKTIARKLCGDKQVTSLDEFKPDEALKLYKKVLGDKFNNIFISDFYELAKYLAYRPYAIRLSAGFLLEAFDPSPRALLDRLQRGDIPQLDDSCSFDVLEHLLKSCIQQLQEKSKMSCRLLDALAVASDEGLSYDHFKQWLINGLSENNFEKELHLARSFGLVIVEADTQLKETNNSSQSSGIKLRLHTDTLRILRAKDLSAPARLFIRYLKEVLVDRKYGKNLDINLQPQILALFQLFQESKEIVDEIYNEFWIHLWRSGQLSWAYELGECDLKYHDESNNPSRYKKIIGNQAIILQAWGRLDEAMKLHKKEETICLELGNKDELQSCYGNQTNILYVWGRFDEAIELLKKQESICLELGNKNGLQACYGNQTPILYAWGKLDEAMELLKKKETICLELGNKDGLQSCYGNQAVILKAWGRLDEAMELLKKVETICLELGNKDGLQSCYGNHASILKAWGRLDEAMKLHKKEETICLELGNKHGLQVCYGNQANILYAWSRLDEAMELHKKVETICLELGNKDGLQITYGDQALILKDWGKKKEAAELLKKKENLRRELGYK